VWKNIRFKISLFENIWKNIRFLENILKTFLGIRPKKYPLIKKPNLIKMAKFKTLPIFFKRYCRTDPSHH
jgi:hypothetical protein